MTGDHFEAEAAGNGWANENAIEEIKEWLEAVASKNFIDKEPNIQKPANVANKSYKKTSKMPRSQVFCWRT